jgi:hypothetical protein
MGEWEMRSFLCPLAELEFRNGGGLRNILVIRFIRQGDCTEIR